VCIKEGICKKRKISHLGEQNGCKDRNRVKEGQRWEKEEINCYILLAGK
jgi:hypothetical protein